VQGSWEQAPSDEAYRRTCDELRQWCARREDPLRILFEGECLNGKEPPEKRSNYADLEKTVALIDPGHFMFPMERNRSKSDPYMTCSAPSEYVEIGLDGQVSVCCRSQDVSLGYATSVDRFSDAWFGENYTNIRHSLRRGEKRPYPLPNCLDCVKFFAPQEAGQRRAVDYSNPSFRDANGLQFDDTDALPIEVIQKEDGFCHIAVFPLGLREGSFELWEDDRRLGPGGCLHDDIRRHGAGRYHIGATAVYFSTSDQTDARRNGRTYLLRRTAFIGDGT
jgi:hypothetical protein